MIGASAALCVAGVPFDGPMGAARVGFIDGNYVLNPSFAELEESFLDMVVAGTEEAVLMSTASSVPATTISKNDSSNSAKDGLST